MKSYSVKEISYNKDHECNEYIFVAKKKNDYMFLTTPKFKFLDVKNYIGPGLLYYDALFNSVSSKLQIFQYRWL